MRRGRMKISQVNPEASGIRLHVGMFTPTVSALLFLYARLLVSTTRWALSIVGAVVADVHLALYKEGSCRSVKMCFGVFMAR